MLSPSQTISTLQALLKLVNQPHVCLKCGTISKEDILNVDFQELGQNYQLIFDALHLKVMELLKQEEKKLLVLQSNKSCDSQSANFLFDDKPKCIDRVTEDLLSNIEEYFEIQNSLTELNMLIQATTEHKDQYGWFDTFQENKEIQERLENALKVNCSQKQILKEVLIKIGDENKLYIQNLQIQIRQQQLEMLSLLKINQEINEQNLKSRIKYTEMTQQSEMEQYQKILNPFEENKMKVQDITTTQQFSRLSSQPNDQQALARLRYQRDSQDQMNTRYEQQSSKKSHSEKENFKTAQSQIDSDDAYFSIQNISVRSQNSRDKTSFPQVAQVTLKLQDTNTNSRYQSAKQGFKGMADLNKFKNLSSAKENVKTIPINNYQPTIRIGNNYSGSSSENPLTSSQESSSMGSNSKPERDNEEANSPRIKQSSRTLASQFGKGGSLISKTNYSSNMLILD